MTLQSSGPIDFGQINVELGLPANTQISLGDTAPRTLSSILTGPISMSNFYSASQGYGYGLFGGGLATSITNYTDKYTYLNNTIIAGTVLYRSRYYLASCGNSIIGIFGGGAIVSPLPGTTITYTDKYTYSNNIIISGTILGLNRYSLAACGNSALGIFGGGNPLNYQVNYTDKYTYSNDSIVAGTVLIRATGGLAACGNSIIGIFGGGYTTTYVKYTYKYIYLSDNVSSSSLLVIAVDYEAATGNSTIGIFGGGYTGTTYSNYTNKYIYGNDSIVSGTILGNSVRDLSACGTCDIGIFGGGRTTTATAYTYKYVYSNNSVVSGTVLGLARSGLAAVSASPGHF
jgi:hypothetical protein